MTNFSRIFEPKYIFAVLLALSLMPALTGCGDDVARTKAKASTAFASGNFTAAIKLYTEVLEKDNEDLEALVMRTRSAIGIGDIALATKTIEMAERIAREEPNVAYLSAQVAFHAEDYKKAISQFGFIAENTSFTPQMRSLGWTGLGIVNMAMIVGAEPNVKRDSARVEFLKALRLDRRNASARYHLGLLYRDAFGYEEAAQEQFEAYVYLETSANPKEVSARTKKVHRDLIPDLRDMINRRMASRLNTAVRDSNKAAALLKKGDEAWKKRNYKTARLRYEEAIAADPLSYPVAMALARSWAATDSSRNGMGKAYGYYRRACELRPGSLAAFLAAGELAEKLGNWASAVELYSRALATNPYDNAVLKGLVKALTKSGLGKSADVYRKYQSELSAVLKQ